MRLGLQLLLEAGAPGLEAAEEKSRLPLHIAAERTSAEAVHQLLKAAPQTALVEDDAGQLPLHLAAAQGHGEAVSLLLQAAPQTALVENGAGRRPLHLALRQHHVGAARFLLLCSGLDTAQLLDVLASCNASLQPLYADLAAHSPLTADQWQRVPALCAAIATALPTVLARLEQEAALVVARLPPSDAERLRVAALSLHHQQRRLRVSLPTVLIRRILASALT